MRVEDLRLNLKVSVATIRRDLEILEENGKLQRVHGGAVTMENRLDEAVFEDKTNQARTEKSRIAEEACKLIGAGDSIYLDGGSTTLGLARLLKDRTDLTLVTNSLKAATELADSGPKVLLIGGELEESARPWLVPLPLRVLGQVHATRRLWGRWGLPQDWLDHDGSERGFVKNLVADQAGQVVLMADSSKAEKVSFARVSDWDAIDVVVTDDKLPKPFAKSLRKRGLKGSPCLNHSEITYHGDPYHYAPSRTVR